jgi:hypothetical protein
MKSPIKKIKDYISDKTSCTPSEIIKVGRNEFRGLYWYVDISHVNNSIKNGNMESVLEHHITKSVWDAIDKDIPSNFGIYMGISKKDLDSKSNNLKEITLINTPFNTKKEDLYIKLLSVIGLEETLKLIIVLNRMINLRD